MNLLFRLSVALVVVACLAGMPFSAPLHAQQFRAVEAAPAWKRALAGETIAGPLTFDTRVYAASADRSVTCLSLDGAFLWSRLLPGKPAALMTVSPDGTVYVPSENGAITALNPDGSFLWQLGGKTPPLFAPYPGRDGRLFLVYRNRVVCITPGGAVKWTLILPPATLQTSVSAAFLPPPSETADGDLLLAAADNTVLRISVYGELLEMTTMPSPVTALSPLPGGYAVSLAEGTVRAFDVRNRRAGADTERVWDAHTDSSALALSAAEGTLVSVHADGTIRGLNITDGSLLWKAGFLQGRKIPVGLPGTQVFISFDSGQFNIGFPGYSCAITPAGLPVWEMFLPSALRTPVVSGTGYVYAATADWILWGYRAETRIKIEKKAQKAQNYGILNGRSTEFGMPFASDPLEVRAFFDRVTSDIGDGTVGTGESGYARRLSEILANETDSRFGGRPYDVTERGRAATLLGQLGSYEYRASLLEAAYGDFDTSLAIGILYGLASLGNDRDGQSLATVAHLVKKAGPRESAVIRAACDALYALIRYSAGKTALEGTRMLSEFLESPYEGQVQLYARKILGNILQ